MKLTPRMRLGLLASAFALPIVFSVVTYVFFPPPPTGNYGELLLPPTPAPVELTALRERWILVAWDEPPCQGACLEKITAMRQVRLALGRNAARVDRVLLVGGKEAAAITEGFEGMQVISSGGAPRAGTIGDAAHIYLVDPHGNVMMRWPARPDMKRMLKDLERLLKASQIG